jgi:hypothetical protein
MEKARGIRGSVAKPNAQPSMDGEKTTTLDDSDAAIAQDTKKLEKESWPVLAPPEQMLPAERIKWENNNEKNNTKELKETETKNKALRTNDILISSMQKTNDSGKLPSGLGKLIVVDRKTGDIRPTAQAADSINKETELYIKNLKQFLKGAKDFFGARVTNFDVSSFMAQLPGLLNSEQGRRLILKQMELVNNLESVHANELDEAIKHYGRKANYIDISRTVDERVGGQEKDLLNKIDNVVEASYELDKMAKKPEKFKGAVLMQTDTGEWKAVKKELIPKYEAKGWSTY